MGIEINGNRVTFTADVSENAKTPARIEGKLLSAHATTHRDSSAKVHISGCAVFASEFPFEQSHLYFRDVEGDFERVGNSQMLCWLNRAALPAEKIGKASKEDAERARIIAAPVFFSLEEIVTAIIRQIQAAERGVYQANVDDWLKANKSVFVDSAGETWDVMPRADVPSPKTATLMLLGAVHPDSFDNLAEAIAGTADSAIIGIRELPNLVPGMPSAWMFNADALNAHLANLTTGSIEVVSKKMELLVAQVDAAALKYRPYQTAVTVRERRRGAATAGESTADVILSLLDAWSIDRRLPNLTGQIRQLRAVMAQKLPMLPTPIVQAIFGVFQRMATAIAA